MVNRNMTVGKQKITTAGKNSDSVSTVTKFRNMIMNTPLGDFGINKADIIVNVLTQYIHDSGFEAGTTSCARAPAGHAARPVTAR